MARVSGLADHHGMVLVTVFSSQYRILPRYFNQSDMMWGSKEDEALAGLRNLFLHDEYMEYNVIVSEEEGLTIQTMEK